MPRKEDTMICAKSLWLIIGLALVVLSVAGCNPISAPTPVVEAPVAAESTPIPPTEAPTSPPEAVSTPQTTKPTPLPTTEVKAEKNQQPCACRQSTGRSF